MAAESSYPVILNEVKDLSRRSYDGKRGEMLRFALHDRAGIGGGARRSAPTEAQHEKCEGWEDSGTPNGTMTVPQAVT
jgi:hypothetical protein